MPWVMGIVLWDGPGVEESRYFGVACGHRFESRIETQRAASFRLDTSHAVESFPINHHFGVALSLRAGLDPTARTFRRVSNSSASRSSNTRLAARRRVRRL